jgi:hypothetical protein
VDGQYWELVAELVKDSFVVLQVIRPFTPPQKFLGKKTKAIKSDAPPPVLKSAKTPIVAIEPPESDPIALNASTVIEETTSSRRACDPQDQEGQR